MARIQVRYVTKRVKPSGRVYWYWQRRGFPLIRLPDDEGERLATATKLNEEADAKKANLPKRGALPDNAVTSVIRLYEQIEGYKELAGGTRTYYDRHLRQILRTFGDLPFSAITRRVVVDYCHGFSTAGEQRKAAAVMSNLFEVAVYHGHATENHARKLRLKTPKRRKEVWTHEEIAAFLDAAKSHHAGHRIALYFNILRYTAQRPGDVAAMTWKQYTGQTKQYQGVAEKHCLHTAGVAGSIPAAPTNKINKLAGEQDSEFWFIEPRRPRNRLLRVPAATLLRLRRPPPPHPLRGG